MQVDETNRVPEPSSADLPGYCATAGHGGIGLSGGEGGGTNSGGHIVVGGGDMGSFNTEAGGSRSGSGTGTGPGSALDSPSTISGGGNDSGNKMNNFKMPNIPTAQKTDPKTKVPSGVKNIQKKIPAPIPAEAHVVPSKIYRAIIASKQLKGKVGTIGGIASGQGESYCGSFFNEGDNRVLRTVYKEDIPSQSVSSLSFNPVK
jgi:hypothetical protein